MSFILNMTIFVGCWVVFCVIGDLVLEIKAFGVTMGWGVIAHFVSAKLADWLTGFQPVRVESDHGTGKGPHPFH